jgi:hypothetical protein
MCHVLLRRPCQYNRNVMHDKQHNKYTFSIKRKCAAWALRKIRAIFKVEPNKKKFIVFVKVYGRGRK